MFETVTDKLQEARKIVFLTGSGISKESGIPTFRDADGLWKKYDQKRLATTTAFKKNPKLVWGWYYVRRRKILAAKPNAAHIAIARLQKYKEVIVLTQNVDGLHQAAGSRNVIELHGSIFKVRCTHCGFRGTLDSKFPEPYPICKCSNILRPDIVWFDEDIPDEIWHKAIEQANSCDVMIIIGTSLVVKPANKLPLYSRKNKATLIEINPESTKLTSKMNISLKKNATKVLPKLVEIFEK